MRRKGGQGQQQQSAAAAAEEMKEKEKKEEPPKPAKPTPASSPCSVVFTSDGARAVVSASGVRWVWRVLRVARTSSDLGRSVSPKPWVDR